MGNPYIVDRKFDFCETLSELPLSDLVVPCHGCRRIFAACCLHRSFGGDLYKSYKKACHHVQLVFTDGACANEGTSEARSGLGIILGEDFRWSTPVDEDVDPDAPRTSQRTELLAAIEGLKTLHQLNVTNGSHADCATQKEGSTYVLVTDSEYVVKGITEWIKAWEVRTRTI